MHKTEQKIERTYTVEGPDAHGRYAVTGPRGLSSGWQRPGQFITPEYNEAVENHIESIPKPPPSWQVWNALNDAKAALYTKPAGSLLHEHTPLTEDEAITLLALLNKITGKD